MNWYYYVTDGGGSQTPENQISNVPCPSTVPIMMAAAVTNVRWPQTPRKAIPVMGISGRHSLQNELCSNRTATWRRREQERPESGASQKARRWWAPGFCEACFFELRTTGRAVSLPPTEERWRGWTCIASHLFCETLKNALSFDAFANSPGSMSRQRIHIHFP